MGRPTVAYIDLDHYLQNLINIKKHVGQNVKVCAMVKADAYGHGLIPISKVAQKSKMVDYLGVATIEEGVTLRQNGITLPILCVGAVFAESLEDAVAKDIMQTIYSTEHLAMLQKACKKLNKQAKVHLKLETGMNRLGISSGNELQQLLDELPNYPDIILDGVFTHFATSDCEDKSFTNEQAKRFDEMVSQIKARGLKPIVHAACSGATLDCPQLHYDMVRPGIATYGYYPSDEVSKDVPLQPVLRWETRLTQIKPVKGGESIGYGRTYFAKNDMVIGVLPVGYGDGYRRALSNKGYVLINGQKAPIVGRICMDQTMVDTSGIKNATTGAVVTLLGQQNGEHIWADEMAKLCDTISYEITLGISGRVPKIYYGEAADDQN